VSDNHEIAARKEFFAMRTKTIIGSFLAFLLITPLLAAQSVASKVSTLPNAVSPRVKACVAGSLATYIELGAEGCEFNDAVFANFSYSGAASGTPDQILVIPVPAGPIVVPYSPGLNFSARWQAARGQTAVSVIHYTVTPVLPTATAIQSGRLALQLGQAQIFGIIGSVSVQESTNVGTLAVGENCADVCGIRRSDSLEFSPLKQLQVTDTVTLNGGLNGASLNSFAADYNFCPQCAQPQ